MVSIKFKLYSAKYNEKSNFLKFLRTEIKIDVLIWCKYLYLIIFNITKNNY